MSKFVYEKYINDDNFVKYIIDILVTVRSCIKD